MIVMRRITYRKYKTISTVLYSPIWGQMLSEQMLPPNAPRKMLSKKCSPKQNAPLKMLPKTKCSSEKNAPHQNALHQNAPPKIALLQNAP